MDNSKYQYEGLKWLMEMELLNHPQALNTIKLNILMSSKHIKEAELLIYRENKSMLVLLSLSWIGRRFLKKRIFVEVQEILMQLLPSFNFRITENPDIMKLAVERVRQALSGGVSETHNNSNGNSVFPSDLSGIGGSNTSESSQEESSKDDNSSEKKQSEPK